MNISNPAKLLRGYMTATGISCAKTISETLGIPLRTVQRLKLEVATASATDGAPSNANDATGGVSESAKCATDGVSDAPEAPNAPQMASRARVEDNNIISLPVDRLVREVITPLSPPLPKTAQKTKRGSRLPDDWTLPDDWREWVRVNCPAAGDAAIDREALKFGNYWQSKAGQQAAKLDWRKTWQNWCLTAFATAPLRNPVPAVAQPGRARAALERMMAEAAQ